MEIIWKIDKDDVKKVREFFEKNKDNVFVKERINRNINKNYNEISKDNFF